MSEISYEDWFLDVLAEGEISSRTNGEFDLSKVTLSEYAIRFNREIAQTVGEFGEESANQAIWYLFGSVSGITHEILDRSLDSQRSEFMNSVKELYANGFAQFCSRHFGHLDRGPERSRPLNSSCYMLWDMDGIECPAINGDTMMLAASLDVLSFALQLDSWACQESALHGLGHLAMKFSIQTTPLIESYLTQCDLPTELKSYAENSRLGCVL